MPSLLERMNKPIFIVSSGRSGSTILTWCLGQHPNIIPQEESDWLRPFAIDATIGYQRGTARGERGQLSANFIQREEFLAFFGQTINELIVTHFKTMFPTFPWSGRSSFWMRRKQGMANEQRAHDRGEAEK